MTKEEMREIFLEEFSPLLTRLDRFMQTYETRPMRDPDLVTRMEACQIKQCSEKTLYNWTEAGLLHPQRLRGRVYYSRKELNHIHKFRTNR